MKKLFHWLKQRWYWLLILLLLLGGGWYFLSRDNAGAQVTYQTVAVERGTLTATVGATGTVRARQTALLTWQTSGIVESVNAKIGDVVQKDQVLASLQKTSLSQSIILAEADLVSAQRQLEDLLQSQTPVVQAWIALRNAQKAYDKAKNYYNSLFQPQTYTTIVYRQVGVPPFTRREPEIKTIKTDRADDETIANAKADLDLKAAQLEDAKRAYERLKDGPDAVQLASLKAKIAAAQATLNLARIIAPFSGVVTQAQPLPGDLVSPGTFAFRVDDLSHLYLDVAISEVDIPSVHVGQDALIVFDAIADKEYHGKVVEVAQAGTQTQDMVSFDVTIELSDADELVRPGMTAAVSIIVREIKEALLIPNRAVRLVDGKYTVYLLKDGQPQPLPVRLGASNETMSVLLSDNLQPGDLLVLNPPLDQRGPGFFRGGR